jgi:hypothetical protein
MTKKPKHSKATRPTHFNTLPSVEQRQVKLAENNEAIERWLRKLFRASTELKKLFDQRKRLLKPRKPDDKAQSVDWTPDKFIGMGGGAVESLDDDMPF